MSPLRRWYAPVLFLVVVFAILVSPSGSATESAPSAIALSGGITLAASQDAYISEASPTTNYGSLQTMLVGWEGSRDVTQLRALIGFDLEGVIPAGATLTSAQLQINQTAWSGATSLAVTAQAIKVSWSQSSVTWNSAPSHGGAAATVGLGTGGGWITWDVTGAVNEYLSGSPNYGWLLYPGGRIAGTRTLMASDSRQSPKLVLAWELPSTATPTREAPPSLTPTREAPPSATPSGQVDPSRTPTKPPVSLTDVPPQPQLTLTPSVTPTAAPTVDLIVDAIEVTQAIQDMHNSVRLVADKPALVRVHMHATSGFHSTDCVLHMVHEGQHINMLPINTGPVYATVMPSRSAINHSFLFYVPSAFLDGELTLVAILNPGQPFGDRDPVETDYNNNVMMETVTFEEVPNLPLVMYRVSYDWGSTTHTPLATEVAHIAGWLMRAYPISHLDTTVRHMHVGHAVQLPYLKYPNCTSINAKLMAYKIMDLIHGSGIPPAARYYGLVSDGLFFMRGCAPSLPAAVASGPVGDSTWGWDFDGNYGDWYTGHELGHAYGRGHANYCGAEGGPSFPNPAGCISPHLGGAYAIYGMDVPNYDIMPPSWRDVMTYCDNIWLSDFTYHALMSYFQGSLSSASAADPFLPKSLADDAMDRLLVVGSIDTLTGECHLEPLMVLPDAEGILSRTPGDHAIVLYGEGDVELARYPFTPGLMEMGPVPDALGLAVIDEADMLGISELVPFVTGTVRVDVEGPEGLLASVSAGAGEPSVTMVWPNGGETLPADDMAVSWMGDDPDGDALSYTLMFSADNGATWGTIASGITETMVLVDGNNVSATTEGLMRIWATDGINTVSDTSDAVFAVPNRPPEVTITQPENDTTLALSQTLSLEAWVYDPDEGTLPEERISWTSDRDGDLGNGPWWAGEALSVGEHVITCAAQDTQGVLVTDTVAIMVVADRADLTPVNMLLADPAMVTLRPDVGVPIVSVILTNAVPETILAWEAACEQDWVTLGATSGATSGELVVGADTAGLSDGTHLATVVLTSPDLPGEQTLLHVELRLGESAVTLPLVWRD